MAKYEFPREGIGMKEFFTEYVRENVEKAIKATSAKGMEGTIITLQFKIKGTTEEYKYCLKISDGQKLEIIEGGLPNPLMEIEMTEANWRDGISQASGLGELMIEQMLDAAGLQVNRKNFDVLKSVKGKIEVEIIRPGQTPVKNITRFNQSEAPSVSVVMALDDVRSIASGETNPQVAFMSGKIKVKGDISLLFKLMPLVPQSLMGGAKK